MRVTISHGNSKIGNIANISMPPCTSCNHDAPCKASGCYARKLFNRFPDTKRAWTDNAAAYAESPDRYFMNVIDLLTETKPKYFRWHVAGDIINQNYLDGMKVIAQQFPKVKFLAFTKMHRLDFSNVPKNLKIIFSMWPGWGDAAKPAQRAWMQDGTENRIPDGARWCKGKCDECLFCWGKSTKDVVFAKH